MKTAGQNACGSGRHPSGSALIVVLWVIGLLSMFVGSFAFDAHVEAKITTYYRNRLRAQYLAKSGVEVAEMLMLRSDEIKKKTSEMAEEMRWYAPAKNLADGLAVRELKEPLGEGRILLDIVPEPARRNVNLLRKEEEWEHVLAVGEITEEMGVWPVLIESFLDWIDADSAARTDGAETDDYYGTLESPYRAKNAPLDTVEELLMIKGWNRTYLFGGTLPKGEYDDEPVTISGIHDLLTTYGDGKVNVNAASKRVLMTLPGVDENVAEMIIGEREGVTDETTQEKPDTSFQNVADFFARMPGLDRPALEKYLTTSSKIFRITSTGVVHGVKSMIWCIVLFDGKNMTILRWWEEQ